MLRFFIYLIIFSGLTGNAVAQGVKCGVEDTHPFLWTRWINEKTLPPGVEVTERVWIRNPTATELMTYTREKGAAARTGYRALLGEVPTTKDELPGTKLVNAERYEFHFMEAKREGWIKQDYTAALIQPSLPKLTPQQEKLLVSRKLQVLPVKVPVLIYFGKKRQAIEFVFEFTKNPNFGVTTPCPDSSPSPKP